MLGIIGKGRPSCLRHLVKNLTRGFRHKPTQKTPYWEQPITQQSLDKFLEDINYFDEPILELKDNSLIRDKRNDSMISNHASDSKISLTTLMNQSKLAENSVSEAIDILSQEVEIPELNHDDSDLTEDDLMRLAQYHGIYRDLFHGYEPNSSDIHFTQDQANRMARLIPGYWISDMPHARVMRKPPGKRRLEIFKPLVSISARYVVETDNDQAFGHKVFYGNIIPANEALRPPSITIDGKVTKSDTSNLVKSSEFKNWNSGEIQMVNFDDNFNNYFTIALINLDSIHPNSSMLHWMVANVNPSNNATDAQQICDYLPVHGIKGFGYSRYTFLLLTHKEPLQLEKISDFSPESRKFNTSDFLNQHKGADIAPVGLSWFQTKWDETSNDVFHDYLKTKAPVYEHVQTKYDLQPEKLYPGRVPFNIYLDYQRKKKDINQQVLLERLKSVDPFDYKDQYVPPKVPETVFERGPEPSWMHNINLKKFNKVGYWRGLRPVSATIPLNNNADLDAPIRPLELPDKNVPGDPNYFIGKYKRRPIAGTPTDKDPNEAQAVFVADGHEMYLEEVRHIISQMKDEDSKSKQGAKKKSKAASS